MKLTDKLDLLMAEKNINKRELSIESGIPYMTIVNFYEKGTENIKLSTLKKLANYFNVSLDYIANDDVTERFSSTLQIEQTTDAALKNNIKKLRMQNGITQTTLADYLGVAQNTLSYWEQSKFDIDNSSLQKIADYFHCSVDYVLGREETNNHLDETMNSIEPAIEKNQPKNNIKKLRLFKNITQTTLADYLGVAQNTLSNWEQGKFDIDNSSLQKIADYFHCSVDYVLGREEKPAPSENPRHTSEELKKKAQEIQSGGKRQHIFAYGGTVPDSELVRKAKALERQRDHSRDDSYLLYQAKEQKSGGVLFGYSSGDWGHETLSEKEMEIVINLIKSLRS